MTHAPACPLILSHVCGDYHPGEGGALIVGVSAGGSACRTAGEGGGAGRMEDVSDPRDVGAPGGLAGSRLRSSDMATIALPALSAEPSTLGGA